MSDRADDGAAGWPSNQPPAEPTDFRRSDEAAGFEILDGFERFNQRDDVFSRAWWDETVHTQKVLDFYNGSNDPKIRTADGFTQRDYALRIAAWSVANTYRERGMAETGMGEGFQSVLGEYRPSFKERMAVDSPDDMTTEIKGLAKLFGADLVGIAEYDERWVYTNAYSTRHREERPNEDFGGMRHVIVLGHEMDYELLKSYPSATASAAVGHGYSAEAGTGVQLSQFIRGLGYRASASMNDTALVVPYAVKAGLGEFGRHNMVITPEFGPRVRFSKIFTDLPLVDDAPIRFGVKEFCEVCDRCSSACPPRAISPDEPTADTLNRSNLVGVRKWQLDGEKCFKYWTNLGSDCGVCIRICPYNKDFSRAVMRIARRLAGTPLRRLMLKLDVLMGYGKREAPKIWWGMIRSR
jgi:reductive dehalogenase